MAAWLLTSQSPHDQIVSWTTLMVHNRDRPENSGKTPNIIIEINGISIVIVPALAYTQFGDYFLTKGRWRILCFWDSELIITLV